MDPGDTCKGKQQRHTGSHQQGGRENMLSIAVSHQLSQTHNAKSSHSYIFSSPDKLQGLCFLVLHVHFHAMGYPDILIFSSTLLTTSIQQTSHLSFHLRHSGGLTRDLKGSFFSMSSNIMDSESISRSMLLILPRTYTTIHEERGSRACYRNSQRTGCIPLQ